ncbi:putative reverse transcriptase domain-containing protein [Tanacetum coccineum]
MYYDLRDMYWWLGMKKDIALYVSKCLNCSKVKGWISDGHYGPMLQTEISEWKMEQNSYGFVHEIAKDQYVGDHVLLKVLPWIVAFIRLPQELNGVHDMFHLLNLKKCLADPTLQIPLKEIQVDAKLNIVEEPVEFLEHEIKKLK